MAIVKNDARILSLGGDFAPSHSRGRVRDRDSRWSDDDDKDGDRDDEDEFPSQNSVLESDFDSNDGVDEEFGDGNDDDVGNVDSGADSDDFDLSDLGEIGADLCQLGNTSSSLPFELYDLPDLTGVLSLDTWNNCLTEEERFGLAEYLPDMDRFTLAQTLRELFDGGNFHFGSPLHGLFCLLKGGLLEPRVSLYLQGLNFLEKRRHYHFLHSYQNTMVGRIIRIKEAWENYAVYSIEERLRLLNILRSKKSFMGGGEDRLVSEVDSQAREEYSGLLTNKRAKAGRVSTKLSGRDVAMPRLSLIVSSNGRDSTKHSRRKSNGVLKVATSKRDHDAATGHFPSNDVLAVKSVSCSASHWQDRIVKYDRGGNDEEEKAYAINMHKNPSLVHGVTVAKANLSKSRRRPDAWKKYGPEFHVGQGEEDESYTDMPYPVKFEGSPQHERSTCAKTMEMSGKNSTFYGRRIKAKYAENVYPTSAEELVHSSKEHRHNSVPKVSQVDWSDGSQHFHYGKMPLSTEQQVYLDDWDSRSKKWKMDEFKTGKKTVGLDLKPRSYQPSPPFMNEHIQSANGARAAEKIRRKSARNGGLRVKDLRSCNTFSESEETESDSSEHFEMEEVVVDATRSSGCSRGGIMGEGMIASVKPGVDPRKVSLCGRKLKNQYDQVDGALHTAVKVIDPGEQSNMPEIEIFSSKGNKRGKANDFRRAVSEDSKKSFSNSAQLSMKDGYVQDDHSRRLKASTLKTCAAKNLKEKADLVANFELGYASRFSEGAVYEMSALVDNLVDSVLAGKNGQMTEIPVTDANLLDISTMPLSGNNPVSRKRKGKTNGVCADGLVESESLQSNSPHPNEETNFSKKRGKKKVDAEMGSSPMVTSDALISEMADIELETKPLKKPFTLITPTMHSGFSFSIIHLLTAVRMAMITVNAEDTLEVGKHFENIERDKVKKNDFMDGNCPQQMEQKKMLFLTVQEIINRVRSNPGDPCILETQEPLQDLVRGVLKIFSSKTAPLGAKGWKPLVFYEKSTKSWSWIGPITIAPNHEAGIEETSADAWGLPHKMLVKLVDSFANWLKSGQETLKLIGSLPPPPVVPMNMDEKERFKDLRAQKSLITISPSSDEVRAYFRQEEFLRYSIPDRAFSYTAVDGRKSTVAPLRRCGGKPTSKAREHFMLKPDRPPHVTILCLVRDAAARLPGSIGTRADVCTLLRDSQYIVEDISDSQVNQIVSGALDRLHYELDPCVQFDAERKLWVYLHREREEEDFEDDGTSSTKKWKRPRKDPASRPDTGGGTAAVYQENEDQVADVSAAGYDPSSEFIVEPSSTYVEEKGKLFDDSLPNMEKIEPLIGSAKDSLPNGHPMGWEVLEWNPLREGKLLCQENSTNEDFGEEAFSRDDKLGF